MARAGARRGIKVKNGLFSSKSGAELLALALALALVLTLSLALALALALFGPV
jgi:hypothetical protein